MVKIVLLFLFSGLIGCTGHTQEPPEPMVYKLRNYEGPEALTSDDVFIKSRECVMNKMRPNVNYLYVNTDQGKAPVPISVICSPY